LKLIRHILGSAALPLAAIVLGLLFSPSGPPAASAAGGDAEPEICHAAPPETGWLESLLGMTRNWLS
jgi:hypothetical protein